MNKHIFGISTYFLTFFLSVILVALFGGFNKETKVETYEISTIAPLIRSYETSEQREIVKLLENDRTFGLEYYKRANQPKAASELVENMSRLGENSQVPPAIRQAYKAHFDAWNDYANHLNSRAHLTGSDNLCAKYDNEISRTYDELLETARDFGVDLPY